jgi:hypothetical protein
MRNLFAAPEPEAKPAAAPNKEGGRECIDDPNKDEPTKGTSLRPKQFERRIIAEIDLENVLPWHMQPDTAYHCFSYGRIDSIAFLRAILKQQPLEYLLIQTWYLSTSHLDEIKKWVEQGLIKHLDFYVGEVFKYKYVPVYLAIKDIVCSRGGRCGILRSHAKVMAGFGERFDFVMEGSANFNINPRCEQTVITTNTDLARFYKEQVFDPIKLMNLDKYDWKPYILKRDETIQ